MALDELRSLIGRHARAGRNRITTASQISLIDAPGAPEFSVTGTMFVLLAQGAKYLAVGDRVHTYGAGQMLLTSVEVPTSGYFFDISADRPALGFGMTLRPTLIADLLLQAVGPEPQRGGRGGVPSGVLVTDATDELIDAVTRLVRLLDRPLDLPVLGPLVEREITWLLIRGVHGEAVRQLGLADSHLSRVAHAVRWLREHFAEPVRVDELARIARMSASAFHRSFHAVTALSPIQFQKQLRLQEARIRLLADHHDVAGVAHSVGYESASQFSRDYRRRFGASPVQDARALRT